MSNIKNYVLYSLNTHLRYIAKNQFFIKLGTEMNLYIG